MEKLGISTTQNVDIEYNIASVGDRILAYILDFIFKFAYVVVLLVSVLSITEDVGWWMFLWFTPVFFYDLACEVFLNGQTFGKMIMAIRVIKIDGGNLNFWACFYRWIFRTIDFNIPYVGGLVGLLAIAIRGKGQRIGDIVAKTTVLKVNAKGSLNATAYVDIEEGYSAKYPEVSKLSDLDMQTIKEVLLISSKENSYSNIGAPHPLVMKTKEVVIKKMGIETKERAQDFLQTVLKDYNYYHQ